MQYVAVFITVVLWFGIVISPTLIGAILGVLLGQGSGFIELGVTLGASVGFIVGISWSEKIRNTTGLINFWSSLVSARDSKN
ncbi:hypothetical protein [Parashewanella tropica]|uniref:hypothetical protein n=1 Tax=Parashewanella tropica TaxID=2547970 RepID=UPI001059A9CD|nr:hypothetical protein [Parashewanella tropica]